MNFHKTFLRDLAYICMIMAFAATIKSVVLSNITSAPLVSAVDGPEIPMATSTNNPTGMAAELTGGMATGMGCNGGILYNIPCSVIFDVKKHGICMDVPEAYYKQSPEIFDKVIYYFNLMPNINYTKTRTCQIDDIILSINKLDSGYLDVFWIIS